MNNDLSKEELLRKFELAYVQRTTIDAAKCESFGGLFQGFFALKDGDNARLIPFMFHDKDTLEEVKQAIGEMRTSFFGVAFVQHYIHYI